LKRSIAPGQPLNKQIAFWQQGQLPPSSFPPPVGIKLFSQRQESSGLSQGRSFSAWLTLPLANAVFVATRLPGIHFFSGQLLLLRLPEGKPGRVDIALNMVKKLSGIERRLKRSRR